eukprot:CAMPEP_0170496558 /NCGR_PEP_ID=MMETSP0208-20121228/22090_1 /TAXON_ID=197538 /ORGANISM="Strombidium inclinatum, Strain S3" /LENGTH=49 /DNA_ID=CAMNT_0010773143 /DNA_START=568 /DNA_END=717 /DNA_ORIENTATION=-
MEQIVTVRIDPEEEAQDQGEGGAIDTELEVVDIVLEVEAVVLGVVAGIL